MRYIILVLVFLLSGCATYYPSPYADRGNQIRYKYSYNMFKCDFCHKDTLIYKVVNGKKVMCSNCYKKVYKKMFKLNDR